jgi:two-component system, NarL family, sensor kinase
MATGSALEQSPSRVDAARHRGEAAGPHGLGLGQARLAWMLAGVSVILSLVGLALLLRNGVSWLEAHPDDGVNGIIYPVVGALILSRRRGHPIGWLFIAIGLATATAIFSAQHAIAGLPGAGVTEWIGRWVWLLGVPLIPTVVVLLFPDGRLPSSRWRPVLWAGVASVAILVPVIALLPEQDPSAAPNPFALDALVMPLSVLAVVGFALLGAASLGALASLFVRYRGADGTHRLQLRWFVAAACMVVFAVVLGNVVPVAGPAVQTVAFPLVALATAAAILRYRLYNIDSVISTSLVWVTLSACVLGAYVALTALVGGLFPRDPGMWPALLATAVVAVAFQPVRVRLQAGVDRLVFGDRSDPARGLRRIGARLEGAMAINEVLPSVADAVGEALRVPAVEVELRHDDRWVPGATRGVPSGFPLELPLTFRGEPVGRLRVYPRAAGQDFTAKDRQLLEDLARQAGVAVHVVQATHALQRSREQLVAALEGERRRIRRDLHDGLGPALAAVSLGLGAARNMRGSDPSAADALLQRLEAEIADVVADLRRLVDGLRPPQLDDLGLQGALEERAAALSSPGLQIDVRVEGSLPDLPVASEAAAYRIANEAMTNAVHHSGGQRCTVRLSASDVLSLEVEDDGTGLPPDDHAGLGLRSMRERADEVGGTWRIAAAPTGGTRVVASLPLDRP